MIDEDLYCDDILNQFLSVEAAINGVRKTLLEAHIKSCVVHQIKEGNLAVVDELITTIGKMTK
ncbi:MAG: metal-sensing transcriptional repressor [Spirochaetales bacterium]|nr:metal-sensing transcriptional repressor [Spirochaetales bacterium]